MHPAPPATTKVHGKTFVLQVVENPYRVNDDGKYDQAYTDARIVEQSMGRLMKDVNDPNYNPWDPNAEGYTTCSTKVLPCTFVVAGGAGCTVRNSIGSSKLGKNELYAKPPNAKGITINATVRMFL